MHPARPAYDECPVCARPRCHPDAEGLGETGCLACTRDASRGVAAGRQELLVRAGLAGLAVSYVGGWIATQYVRVHLMSLVAPAVVGLAANWAVSRAGRQLRSPVVTSVTSVIAALLGTALGFVLTPGGQNPLRDWGLVGGPYLASMIGVALGPLVFGASTKSRPGDGGGQPPPVGDGADVGTAR